MVYERLVEIGRVVFIISGPDENKLATIVDVVDGNRALVDGPCSNVSRKVINFNTLQLTKFKIDIRHGQRTGKIKKAWDAGNISDLWAKTQWAKKLNQRALKLNMNDFDRFKLMKARQMRARIIRCEAGKIKKAQKSK